MHLRVVLQEECRVNPALPVLVGVSGGPDSLCLLDVLHRLEYRVIVAHFDHCLRPDSAQDAVQVQQVAESLGLPFILGKEDVGAFAQTERLSLEEAARKARYRFLFAQARHYGAQAVAVAHSADDQVETVLMHLLRGSGLSGLRGMAYRGIAAEWDREIPLIRPLLGTWRTEIMAYCQQHGLQPHFDPTNQDTAFFRNRLRHDLIPALEQYNPQVRQIIWRTARTLAADHDVLEEYLQPLWVKCILDQGPGFICLSRAAFQALLLAQKRSVMRNAIASLRPDMRDIDFSSIQRATDFITHPTATLQTDLVSNLRLFLEGDKVYLAEWNAAVIDRAWPQLPPGFALALAAPGEVELLNGFRLHARLEDTPSPVSFTTLPDQPFQAWLDADRLSLPISVRPRRPGDRYRPLGMDGHSLKLSDFFISHRLPARARNGWPLVCDGEVIAWVPGFQPAHDYQVTQETRRILYLELIKAA
jgi:tRNA(Ile)-lysidine synthase